MMPMQKLVAASAMATIVIAIGIVLLVVFDETPTGVDRLTNRPTLGEHRTAQKEEGERVPGASIAPRSAGDHLTEEAREDSPRASTSILSVAVRDTSGEPLAGARVSILRESPYAAIEDRIRRGDRRAIQAFILEHERRFQSSEETRNETATVLVESESDTAGRCEFSIDHLPQGRLRILAEKAGYASDSLSTLRPEESRAIDLRLAPGRTITGLVLDTSGQGLAGARITASAGEDESGAASESFVRSAQHRGPLAETMARAIAGASGRFTLHVPNGSVQLTARAPGFCSKSVPDVAAGTEGVTITLEPAVAISGVVVDSRKVPIPGARIALYESQSDVRAFDAAEHGVDAEEAHSIPALGRRLWTSAPQRIITAASDGRFRFDEVDVPRFSLVVRANGFVPAEREGDLSTRNFTEPVEILLDRAAILRGVVKNPSGAPVGGAFVTAGPAGGDGESSRIGADEGDVVASDPFGPNEIHSAPIIYSAIETDIDGRFVIDTLPAGEYALRVESDGYAPRQIASVSLESELDVEIALEEGFALRGRVLSSTDGAPLDHATLSADIDRDRRSVVTTGDGRYKLDSLTTDTVDRVWISAPGFERSSFENVRAGGEVDFEVDPEARLSGRVMSTSRVPVARARVTLVPSAPLEPRDPVPTITRVDEDSIREEAVEASAPPSLQVVRTTTDADGRFELGGIQGGSTFTLAVDHSNYKRLVREDVVLGEGDTLDDLELILLSGTVLEVHVTDRRGSPVPRAIVQIALEENAPSVGSRSTATGGASAATPPSARAPRSDDAPGAELSSVTSSSVNRHAERWTGPDGRAVFFAMEAGIYRVRAEAEGFQTGYLETWASDESTRSVFIALETEHELTGRILDPAGLAIERAIVTAVREKPDPRAGVLGTSGFGREAGDPVRTRSGPDGAFRIGRLSPTSYFVSVEAQGYSRAELVKVRVDREIDITLIPLGSIAGKVVNVDTGEPVFAFRLLVRDAKDDPSLYPLAPEERERVGGTAQGDGGRRRGQNVFDRGRGIGRGEGRGDDGFGRRLELGSAPGGFGGFNGSSRRGRGPRVPGDGPGEPGDEFGASQASRSTLGGASFARSGAGLWHSFRTGEFRVSDIERGTWVVEVVARGYSGAIVAVNLDAGEAVDDLEIPLEERLSIRGFVRARNSSERLPNAELYLVRLPERTAEEQEEERRGSRIEDRLSGDSWDRNGRRDLQRSTELALGFVAQARSGTFRERADEEGSFAFRDVPDGDYVLVAERAGYLPISREIIVREGIRAQYALDLDPGESLLGRVRWRRRGGGRVTIIVEGANGLSQRATTDRAGRYKVSGLLPGEYQVRILSGSEVLAESLPVEIEDGKRNELDYRHDPQ